MEKTHLLKAIETVPCVQRKANWALKWCNSANTSFAERMIAFAAVEGIFFSGSFCAFFWLKKRGLMPGLSYSNKLISHNEGLHCNFACLIYSKLNNRLPKKRIFDIINSAVDIKIEFIVNALPIELIRMNLNYALVGERIGGWCSILKVRRNTFGDCFGNEILKVMLRFCLVDVRLLVAYLLPLPLSYPKKES